jgi:hypothetical protein
MLDRHSPTWVTLKRQIDQRIEKLRDDLEQPDMDPAGIRGEIAALRWVKKTVEPDAPITEPTGTDYLKG